MAASEHWGLMLSSAHLNPKALVIQPVSPQPVMQNFVLIKFHYVLPAYAWSSLDGSPALEQVACITHLAMSKLCKGPVCIIGMDVKPSVSQGAPLIMSHGAQTNNPFPLNMLHFFHLSIAHLSNQGNRISQLAYKDALGDCVQSFPKPRGDDIKIQLPWLQLWMWQSSCTQRNYVDILLLVINQYIFVGKNPERTG